MKPTIRLVVPAQDTEALPSNALCLVGDNGPWLYICWSREQVSNLINRSRLTTAKRSGILMLLSGSCVPKHDDKPIQKIGGAEASEITDVVMDAARSQDPAHLPERATHVLYARVSQRGAHAFFGACTPRECRFHVAYAKDQLQELLMQHRDTAMQMGFYESSQKEVLASALPDTGHRPLRTVEGSAALVLTTMFLERMNARRSLTN